MRAHRKGQTLSRETHAVYSGNNAPQKSECSQRALRQRVCPARHSSLCDRVHIRAKAANRCRQQMAETRCGENAGRTHDCSRLVAAKREGSPALVEARYMLDTSPLSTAGRAGRACIDQTEWGERDGLGLQQPRPEFRAKTPGPGANLNSLPDREALL